jgi:two-component system sensor histidine kinase DesK
VFLVPSPTYVIVGFTGGGGVQGHPLVAVLVAIPIGVIQLRHGLAAARGARPRGWRLTFGALVVLVYLPMLWWTWNWAAMQWFVMASAPMLLRGPTAVLITDAPLLGTVTTAFVDPVLGSGLAHGADESFYWVTGLGLGAFAVFGSARLVRALDELQAARAELAEAAVGRERLRMSRDLHDVPGQALSAVSLKGDLALALLPHDPVAGRAELAKQLLAHLGRKAAVEDLDDEPDGGRIVFAYRAGTVRAQPDRLVLVAEAADPESLARVQKVLGRHLERFGARRALTVSWSRP